jgi:hypothetical protein
MVFGVSPHARLVDRQVVQSLDFTNHAIERFAERTGLPTADRRSVEPIVRDLLQVEGRIVDQRPGWGRSSNHADLYVQVGEWLLFLCQRETRPGRPPYAVVTVINNADMDWRTARARGLVFTPVPLPHEQPPQRHRAKWGESFAAARKSGKAKGLRGLLDTTRVERRARQAQLDARYNAQREAFDRRRRIHDEARTAAYEKHRRLWS